MARLFGYLCGREADRRSWNNSGFSGSPYILPLKKVMQTMHFHTLTLPFCHLTLKAQKPLPSDYPLQIKSLGDHIRKRRLDLKIFQKEAAKKIGVDETTIWFWENNRVEPSISFIPKIIDFLGYIPFKTKYNNLEEKIIAFRRIHGLSQKKLASLIGIDSTTIGSWERDEHKPSKELLEKLLSFFTAHTSSFSITEE